MSNSSGPMRHAWGQSELDQVHRAAPCARSSVQCQSRSHMQCIPYTGCVLSLHCMRWVQLHATYATYVCPWPHVVCRIWHRLGGRERCFSPYSILLYSPVYSSKACVGPQCCLMLWLMFIWFSVVTPGSF